MKTNDGTTPTLAHLFNVDLSDKFDGEDYWLHVAGKKYPLVAHTPESRERVRNMQPQLRAVPDDKLTHYTAENVVFPLCCVIRLSVRHTNKTGQIPGEYGIHHACINVVPRDEEHMQMAAANIVEVAATPIDWVATAKTLLFHHADLITTDCDMAIIIYEHMDQATAPATYDLINDLANKMEDAGLPRLDGGWAQYKEFDAASHGKHQSLIPTQDTINHAGDAMTALQKSTKNDPRLKGASWTEQKGSSVQPSDGNGHKQSGPEKLGSVQLAGAGDNWTASLSNTDTVNGLETSISIIDSSKRQVQISMNNYYVRWLGAYIQFTTSDKDGNEQILKTPDWQPDDDYTIGSGVVGILSDILNYDDMRIIGWISPIDTIFSIPVSSDPGTLTVTVTFPEGATSAQLYGCGLGTGNNQYPKTTVAGGILTGLANLGVPVFLLGFGAAVQSYKKLYKIFNGDTFITLVKVYNAVYFTTDFTYEGSVNKQMDWSALSSLSQLLFSDGASEALTWVEEQCAVSEVEDEIPFAGWIMVAINIATTLAQMAETIVEVATSPWMIPNSIATTITSTLTINPDPRIKVFPAGSTATYVAKMIYRQQNRPAFTSPAVTLNPQKYPDHLISLFNNTLGGQVKFEVDFYTNNWLAGKATSGWLVNDEDHAANVTLSLVQKSIPLSSKSVYKHTTILGYQNNAYAWIKQSTPPTATIANADTNQSGNAISDWTCLEVSQRSGMIGVGWKAAGMGIAECSSNLGGQLYAFENFNIPGSAIPAARFSGCGFSAPSELVYDVFPPKFIMKDGNFVPDPNDVNLGDYYVDPRKAGNDPNADGGYHLRQVVLDDTTPFNMSANQNSFARFPYYPDSLSMHPSGHVIGVNRKYFKMMITALAPAPGLKDDNIPLAKVFAGQALNYNGSGGRAGLLFIPVAVTTSYDGTILVLEQLSSAKDNIARIQAFDLNGRPVNCFQDAQGIPSPFLMLPPTLRYLDIVAVGDNYTTYIYVLYYANNGTHVSDYSMSLYQCGQGAPKGNLLVTTNGIPAARLNVDMWHTLYTLNYAMTEDGSGNKAGPNKGGSGVGTAGVTVPSVSEWLPPLPG